MDAPGSPRPMRYSSLSLKDLVCLCAGPLDDEAWEEFVSRVGRPISLTIMWTASQWGERSRSVVQDLVHDTYIKLWKDSCRLLRDFAIQHPDEAILRYIKKTAANTTHDYFRKHGAARYRMIDNYDATIDIDLNFTVLLKEIDEHLKHCLIAPDHERDRTIFWLYFRRGMSTKEIASLPTIGLSAKGVGSVIERLKHCLRERILRLRVDAEDDKE
jgi:RNA polymerase sigma-70 factor, ECF subfamily